MRSKGSYHKGRVHGHKGHKGHSLLVQVAAVDPVPGVQREAGPIGGTGSDLRRLSMPAAQDLLKRLGMAVSDIERA